MWHWQHEGIGTAALDQSGGPWSTATINNRLDTRVASQGLVEWSIAEMDRTSSTI